MTKITGTKPELFAAELSLEVARKRIDPDAFDWLSVAVEDVELATALGIAEMLPVRGLVAGAGKARLLDEGFEHDRPIGVASLPVGGQPATHQGEDARGQGFAVDPRQDEEASIIDDQIQIALSLICRPADELIARLYVPGTRAEAEHGDDVAGGAHEVAQLRAVAIGVSTGGPAALIEILRGLPRGFPLPILLVIQIGKLFAPAFADWLDGQGSVRVGYAVDGDPLPPCGEGRVLMASADSHLVLRQGKLRLTQDPERHSCRPSVDVLFESMAQELGADCAACLLPGMGRNGAEGLLAIRRADGGTIAQDEATSVVFGMPREAILLGAAEQVLPLEKIAPALGALANGAAAGRQI